MLQPFKLVGHSMKERDKAERLTYLYSRLNKWDRTFRDRYGTRRQIDRARSKQEEIWAEIEKIEAAPYNPKG